MKKILLLIGFVAGVTLSVNAQYFTTSYGLQLNWGIPSRVENIIHHDYYGYEWVHASRVSRVGFDFFDIVLRRGDIYIEVSVRNDGFITRRSAIMDYPLYEHVCGSSCGYHNTYYTSYNNGCNSHSHSGHNHVVYYSNYGHNQGHGHAYEKHNNGHNNGNAYGKHKNEKYESHNTDNKRQVQKSSTYTRRDRYYDSNNKGDHSEGRGSVNNNRTNTNSRSTNSKTTSSRTR
jgi:hypothetical protein